MGDAPHASRMWVLAVVMLLALTGCTPTGRDVVPTPAPPRPSPTGGAPQEPAAPTGTPAPAAPTDRPTAILRPLLSDPVFDEWSVPAGTRPHDVAPAPDGRVWFTGQRASNMGLLEPATGEITIVDLPEGAAPHGVIVADDGVAWVTDGGLNAIVAINPHDLQVVSYPLPGSANANLNTASFDGRGMLWFTGQNGIHGRLHPDAGEVVVFDSPRQRGPYGIATTPSGDVWFSSLAGSYIARILDEDGSLEVVDTPTPGGGARRVWSDSAGALWVTEWFAGNLARYVPTSDQWTVWPLPGDDPQPYAVWVDDVDMVWVTDFRADALVRFDPSVEEFRSFPWPTPGATVRQLLGRPGEVWGAGSGTDTIIVLRTR